LPMNLRRVIRYLNMRPKVLFNYSLILSISIHSAMLVELKDVCTTSLPAQKGSMTIINIDMEDIDIHSKTNVIRNKRKSTKEKKLQQEEKKIIKNKVTIPSLKDEKIEKNENKEKEESEQEQYLAPLPSISKEDMLKAEETYQEKVLKRILRMKHYPAFARKMNHEGSVMVKFILTRNGGLKGNVIILKGCSHDVLNEASIKTIVGAVPFPPFPSTTKKDEMTFIIDLDFNLNYF